MADDVDPPPNWAELARRIAGGDRNGVEYLYRVMADLIRRNISRAVGSDSFEDHLHEIVVIVLDALRSQQLRDPDKLPGFIRTIARRRMAAHIRDAVRRRRRFVAKDPARTVASARQSPEALLSHREREARVRTALDRLSARDREILERFYFYEQTVEQICGEMNLTGTQFRLYKSRAIAKCSHFAQAEFG